MTGPQRQQMPTFLPGGPECDTPISLYHRHVSGNTGSWNKCRQRSVTAAQGRALSHTVRMEFRGSFWTRAAASVMCEIFLGHLPPPPVFLFLVSWGIITVNNDGWRQLICWQLPHMQQTNLFLQLSMIFRWRWERFQLKDSQSFISLANPAN